ncbi:unnamed protein product [Lactuca virosa]|uniref:Uncharacterized protein n=1 Tax=Lactuca virosa TaxID=75947 RepID=A0AAU9LU42_9ASTR|nr:unnamed protein product [Lactuca virosa]
MYNPIKLKMKALASSSPPDISHYKPDRGFCSDYLYAFGQSVSQSRFHAMYIWFMIIWKLDDFLNYHILLFQRILCNLVDGGSETSIYVKIERRGKSPRLKGEKKGLFATRSPHPYLIGPTVAKVKYITTLCQLHYAYAQVERHVRMP